MTNLTFSWLFVIACTILSIFSIRAIKYNYYKNRLGLVLEFIVCLTINIVSTATNLVIVFRG